MSKRQQEELLTVSEADQEPAIMAAVGAEVTGSWFLTSGPVSFFILLLLLTIFLTALCSNCRRGTIELQDSEPDHSPLGVIRMVNLEEAEAGVRENPAITEIQSDEENPVSVTAWRSHLGAPQNHRDVRTNGSAAAVKTTRESDAAADPKEENPVPVTLWRNHLWQPQDQDLNSPTPPDSAHIIGGGRSSSSDAYLTPNQKTEENGARFEAVVDRNSPYARLSKKAKPTTPPAPTPVEVLEEEEEAPPLPDRKLEG